MKNRDEATLESRLGNAVEPQKLDAQATGTDRIEQPAVGRDKKRDEPSSLNKAQQRDPRLGQP